MFKVEKVKVDAYSLIIHFYIVEALKTRVSMNYKFGMKSQERLLEDITEYQDELVIKTKQRLMDYNPLVVYGEMRHSLNETNEATRYKGCSSTSHRGESYEEAVEYDPINILERGESIFSELIWSYGYGGDKWAFIANRAQLFDKMNDREFCDMCFSLSHNSSVYLDKYETDIFAGSDRGDYKRMLDHKFERDLEYLIYKYLRYIGRRLNKLIKRTYNLGFLEGKELGNPISYIRRAVSGEMTMSEYFDNQAPSSYERTSSKEEDLFNYKPLEWGSKIISDEYEDSVPNEYDDGDRREFSHLTFTEYDPSKGKRMRHSEIGYGHLVVVTNPKLKTFGKVGVVRSVLLYTNKAKVDFNDGKKYVLSIDNLDFAYKYLTKGMSIDCNTTSKYRKAYVFKDALLYDVSSISKGYSVSLQMCFKKEVKGFHDLGGLVKSGHGWNISGNNVIKINFATKLLGQMTLPTAENLRILDSLSESKGKKAFKKKKEVLSIDSSIMDMDFDFSFNPSPST